jgi:heme-degrading monooxygenase HmoA
VDDRLAPTPAPPYTAVIFTSVRSAGDDGAYATMAAAMEHLGASQPGFLGIESVRDPVTRLGITVSYWRTEADALAWRDVAEHLGAQRLGRERWYAAYRVRVATVHRSARHPER